MQLVEAVILLLVGMVPGVWVTLFDVYAVGASAFSTRVSLWLLLVMVLACNARYRRQASLGAAALSFGYIETYYLCSSFTFAGMARSAMAPLALLAVLGYVIASVGWLAKRERGALGLALKALVVVATLVACVATHDGVGLGDVVCTLIIAYLLLIMRSRKVALEHHRPDPALSAAEAAGRGTGDITPERPSSPQRHRRRSSSGGRESSRSTSERRRQSSSRPRVSASVAGRSGREGSLAEQSSARASSGTRRQASRTNGERPTQAKASTSKGNPKAKTREAQGTRPTGGNTKASPTRQRKAASSANHPTGTKGKAQRPTRRTGGAVPEANRIRTSASDRHGQGNSRQRRSTAGSTARRR